MIDSRRALLLAAALTFVVGVVALFPARVAYRWAAPSQLAVSGIHGTVWRGGADAVASNGVYLRDLTWTMKPLRLITGKAVYRVKASPVSGFVEGDVGLGFGGSVVVSDLAASLPLSALAGALNIRGLRGEASLEVERLKLRDGVPVVADGTVQLNNLVVPRISRDSIGGYRVEFFTQDSGVSASVEDTDDVVDLAGSLQVHEDRSFQFLGQVIATPATPANLQQQMKMLGPANERGQRELRLEGSL